MEKEKKRGKGGEEEGREEKRGEGEGNEREEGRREEGHVSVLSSFTEICLCR